jgi:hypothetical protein
MFLQNLRGGTRFVDDPRQFAVIGFARAQFWNFAETTKLAGDAQIRK